MREYAAGTVVLVIGSRSLGSASEAEYARLLEESRARLAREHDELLRLYASANGFDASPELPEPEWWPSPQPTRPPLHRARRGARPRRPQAPRLVSWLVEGRGR